MIQIIPNKWSLNHPRSTPLLQSAPSEFTQVILGYICWNSQFWIKRDYLLKPELLRAIVDSGFEHPQQREKMEYKEKVFKISFKAILTEISPQLGIRPPTYTLCQISENTFSASVHIKGIIHHATVTYIGRYRKEKNEAEEDAARIAIQELKKLYNFHVDDVNFEAFQRAQGNFEDLEHLYEELLKDYKKLENELKNRNAIEGTGSSTSN